MADIFFDSVRWPFGLIHVVVGPGGLLYRIFLTETLWNDYRQSHDIKRNNVVCDDICVQLLEYLAGERKMFVIPIVLQGTEFQNNVWSHLMSIPYGTICSYSCVAQAVGHQKAARAVGTANRFNPLPIVIPCHRVIAKNGALSGYLGGNGAIKRFLLDLEKSSVR